jgi:pilus assembly protein CpaE
LILAWRLLFDRRICVAFQGLFHARAQVYPMNLPAVLIGSHTRIGDVRQCLTDLSVQVTAEYTDIAQCMRSLSVDSARKLMFAMDVQSTNDVGDLAHLSTQYGGACLAVLDDSSESTVGKSSLWHQAMRAGASQVIGRPLDITDMGKALSCLNRLFGDPNPACTVIAVTGASGGSGATTLAINLAHELAYLTNVPCILSEQEERMAMLASCLDLTPRHTLADLMKMSRLDPNIVEQTLVPYGEKLRVLCGSQGSLTVGHVAEPYSPESMAQLIAILRGMCQFLVIDVSCTLSPRYFDLLSQADRVAIVAEQTLPSMRNLRLLQDALRPMELQAGVDVIVNKFDSRVSGFSLAGIKDIIASDNVWTVENAPAVATGALNLGRPLRVHSERAAIVEDISKIARSIAAASGCTQIKPPESSRFFSFLKRLA